jgi:hypothetical protein
MNWRQATMNIGQTSRCNAATDGGISTFSNLERGRDWGKNVVTVSAHKFVCSGRDFDILCTDRQKMVFRDSSSGAVGGWIVAAEKVMPNQKAGPRYRADITAGSLKVTESRHIADLLLHEVDANGWSDAIVKRNILQARTPATALRLARLIRSRLESMGPDLWKLVRDGKGSVAMHAVFAAAVKQSPLLGDFLGMVVADQYRRFGKTISNKMFADYLDGCRERDPLMPAWTEKTQERIRSSVFQMLAQAGYLENTRSLQLQPVHIADQVLHYLNANGEDYVARCLQVAS